MPLKTNVILKKKQHDKAQFGGYVVSRSKSRCSFSLPGIKLYIVFLIKELFSWFTFARYLSHGRDHFAIKGKCKHCLFVFFL